MATKFCVGCKAHRDVADFYVRTASPDGLQYRCKACDKEVSRANALLAKYGMTCETYDALLDAQDGRCAICVRGPVPGRRLVVDHCHGGSGVRGLLCDGCNLGIGHLGDTAEHLRAALAYLETHEAK